MYSWDVRRRRVEKHKDERKKRRRRVSSVLIRHLAQDVSWRIPWWLGLRHSRRHTHTHWSTGLCCGGYSILWVLGNWSVVPLEKTPDFIGSANRTFVCHVSLFQGASGARQRELWAYSGNRPSHTWVGPATAVMNLFTWPFTQKEKRWIKKGGLRRRRGCSLISQPENSRWDKRSSLRSRGGGSFISRILLPHLHHLSPRQWSTYHKCTHPAHQ